MNNLRSILLFLFLAAIGTQIIMIAAANPSPAPSTLPGTPDTSKPSIIVQLPEPDTVYNVKNVPYSITIEKPASWIENGTGYIRSVGYTLDGKWNATMADINEPSISMSVGEKGKLVFTPNPDYIDLNSNRTITINGNLSGLSEGNHTLEVWVNSVSVYHPADTPQNFYGWWKAVAEVPVATSSEEVYFSVTDQPLEATTFPTGLAATASFVVLGVIALGLAVTSRKRKLPVVSV